MPKVIALFDADLEDGPLGFASNLLEEIEGEPAVRLIAKALAAIEEVDPRPGSSKSES